MLKELFTKKLMPAVTIKDADAALPLAEAILEGGLDTMEITFRSPATASAISVIAREYPEMHIGAGTILTPEQITLARNAGAQFGLAPGFNQRVAREAEEKEFPFIPGIATPSEVEKALDNKLQILKLFPANTLGGVDYIRSLEGPFGHTGVRFLPMGGVNERNMDSYLGCSSVIAVGGSWMTPGSLIEQKKFSEITKLVRNALAIAGE